ncbi:MAG: chemotaxis histidine kinaselike protein [Frankiales bacterium]|nr:chemotaxis histidine kinaselike protein [Frankiales bacterium]
MSRADRREALLALFAQESQRRLDRMAAESLDLDASAGPEELASLFRDAHTVKGSAAVMGFEDLTELAHVVEDLLDALRLGRLRPVPQVVDALLLAVDDLRALTAASLAGTETAALSAAGQARLRAALETPEPLATPQAPESPETPETPETPQAPKAPAPAPAPAPALALAVPAPPVEVPVTRAPEEASRLRSEGLVVPVERLDEMVRLVGEAASAQLRLGTVLAQAGIDPQSLTEHRDVSRWLAELQQQTMRARMVPVSTVVERLRRGVRELARSCGKQVVWDVRGEDTELDRSLLDRLGEALLHLVRNAVDHGLEPPQERVAAGKPAAGTVRLHAMQLGGEVVLTVTDDGRGLDVARLREKAGSTDASAQRLTDDESAYLVFRSGLSTARTVSEVSGRGVGLDAVRHSLDEVRGRIEVHSTPGVGCEFRLVVPLTLAVLPSLLVTSGGQRYAVPMHSIVTVLPPDEPTRTTEGVPSVRLGEAVVPVASLAEVLGTGPAEDGPVVVLTGTTRRMGLRVQGVQGQREVVVKSLSPLVGALDCFTGASVEPDGSVLLVLDAAGTINRARAARAPRPPTAAAPPASGQRASVLVVDDALTVRELQRSILERAGYRVRTAGHGQEALGLLAQEPADLVLTDVEMPVMDGFALTEAIRASDRFSTVPVLVLTSRASDRDRQRGLQAGADGYLVKSAFDEAALLSAVTRLLGDA